MNEEIQTLLIYQICDSLRFQANMEDISVDDVMDVMQENIMVECLLDGVIMDKADVQKIVIQYVTDGELGEEAIGDKMESMYSNSRKKLLKEIDDLDNTISTNRKKDKLLNLYRDTVLNRLQNKKTVLDKLYHGMKEDSSVIRNRIYLERIKNETPNSIAELQLMLQRSIADCIMSEPIGSEKYNIAKEIQINLEDTIRFMKRALE
ncbi:uncharacterized protein GVI51_M03157 [Nakaseomyces glabratus]|uniref:Chromatin modification-related protein EAF5 n=2 Tax=Candida glabrata TaxID=5478 RepID=EAF5_CANGA|nr:uncharacterized protein CAGL0M03289g [Nakaseomyces glabratus]Q6FJV4.1 RecName: Full=Chromatin modification-related protein EAF5 [Nakaseomyces glabratus CBS 138]KAH7578800.1 hypothetical protein J7297_04822 [Nakaseomyces glabratus]KAH7579420.1 hypothetical protein J7298_04819 [Nakaseomyces glabratus]KAH7580047.1 hypothetical protein J7296_04799 [Nakaseomyces glabratus]KAH7592601.1 hypothetical protein J7295_04814 [Nakaseomyces glabratus]KAH7593670.1 hypothetical protein J7294_04815 [Nakaseo|eukprot:XP_449490.1 uncharacterized protein CAGL0M03289g [[Candida] glabrata]